MTAPIRLPEIGAGQATLSVSCWLVDTGELVDLGDRVVELVTASSTFDVPAPVAGRLSRIDKPLDAAYWRDHLRHSVLFADSVQHCYDGGSRIFLEVGPNPVLLVVGVGVAADTR